MLGAEGAFTGDKIDDAITAADGALERAQTMAKAGQGRAALANAKAATRLYRQLAVGDAPVYVPDLALSLQVESDFASAVGKPDDALAAAQESVSVFRSLAEGTGEDAALFGPYLGSALCILAARLHEAGADDEALDAVREGIHLFDHVDAEDIRRHRIVLEAARLLRNELSPHEHRLDEEFGALHD
jgi:hypothetical protein